MIYPSPAGWAGLYESGRDGGGQEVRSPNKHDGVAERRKVIPPPLVAFYAFRPTALGAVLFLPPRNEISDREKDESQQRRSCGHGVVNGRESGSSRFVVNDPAVAGIHATVLAALVSRIRVR